MLFFLFLVLILKLYELLLFNSVVKSAALNDNAALFLFSLPNMLQRINQLCSS